MTTPEWSGISAEAKDFIKKVLVANPANRMNAQQIKNHPWISGKVKVQPPSVNVLHKMRDWNTKRKIEMMNNKEFDKGGEDREFQD